MQHIQWIVKFNKPNAFDLLNALHVITKVIKLNESVMRNEVYLTYTINKIRFFFWGEHIYYLFPKTTFQFDLHLLFWILFPRRLGNRFSYTLAIMFVFLVTGALRLWWQVLFLLAYLYWNLPQISRCQEMDISLSQEEDSRWWGSIPFIFAIW